MKKLFLPAMIIAVCSAAAVNAEPAHPGQHMQQTQQSVNEEMPPQMKKYQADRARQNHNNAIRNEQRKYKDPKNQSQQQYNDKKQPFDYLKKFK